MFQQPGSHARRQIVEKIHIRRFAAKRPRWVVNCAMCGQRMYNVY
jgi:hypothetical protein